MADFGSLLYVGCFGSLLTKVWVLLKDPWVVLGESLMDVGTLYTIFYQF